MAEAGKSDAAFLLDMLLAAQDARSFVGGLDETAFLESKLHQNAVIRSLEIIGEAANRLSEEARAANLGIPWADIIGMRHRLVHGYSEVRLDIVWSVATERLTELTAALEAAIEAKK